METLPKGRYLIPFAIEFPMFGNNGEQLQENLRNHIEYSMTTEVKTGFFTTLKDNKEIKIVGRYDYQYEMTQSHPVNVTVSHEFTLGSPPLHMRIISDKDVYVLMSKPSGKKK